jgi:hypothetical protein
MPPYSADKLSELLAACDTARGSYAKGQALEDLGEYIFGEIPGVSLFERDVLDDTGAQELDLVFNNYFHLSGLPISDVTLIVECKNERHRTKAPDISVLTSKIESRSLRIGVLLTRRGVSGRPTTAGHAAIHEALLRGVSLIVITWEDCTRLETTEDLVVLLTQRLQELRVRRYYHSV